MTCSYNGAMTFLTDSFRQQLDSAAQALALPLTDEQSQQLLRYLNELALWNKKFNLTAITAPHDMLVKHVFDSMSVLPHLPTGSLLDVGTGAGLPGVIIAICQPERQVTVLDSNSKKIRFIRQVVANLHLKNVSPEHLRIEAAAPLAPFDVITSRAFASLVDFTEVCAPLLSETGQLFAMKGVLPSDEITQLSVAWEIDRVRLAVPELADERHAVLLRPRSR